MPVAFFDLPLPVDLCRCHFSLALGLNLFSDFLSNFSANSEFGKVHNTAGWICPKTLLHLSEESIGNANLDSMLMRVVIDLSQRSISEILPD